MSDTILSGDITVYYLDENRRKQLVWTGGTTTTYTLNQVYSALADLFDEAVQMDDGSVMSAETPVEYTIGIIDSGDSDPWYVTYDCMEHIKAGALRTSSWTRATGSNTGIIVVPVTDNNIVTGDIGNDISGATTGNGTLLEVIEAGTTDYLVIRPDSSAAGDDFTTASQVITEAGTSHTATQSGAASFTSEQIWANLYTIGTIETDTHIYLYQGTVSDDSRARISSITDSTQDWWSDGLIDVCIYTKDFTQDGPNNFIDGGYIKAFARKGSTYYDSFETATSTTSGGRNPVPVNTAADLDNSTGYSSITLTGATGNFSVGDEIEGQSSGARAVITQIDNPGSGPTLHYYLIDDPQTDFSASETVDNNDDSGSGTEDGSGPTDQGPANSGWFSGTGVPTLSLTHTTYDVDDNGTDENYGITIDCNQNTLSEVYEWLKYNTRNGATGGVIFSAEGINGEQYVGAEAYLAWSGTVTGTIAEGADVTQANTNATGVIVSYYDSGGSGGYMLLRDVRGTFNTSDTVTDLDNSGTVTPNTAATNFAPNKQSSFGSFPGGGTFFGARGVLLSDWASADENNFSLIPVSGGTKQRPQAYTITVTNLVGTNDESVITDDRVTVFRLTAEDGDIDKTEFSAYGGESIGDATLDVDTAINKDVPGKTTGGVLRIRDDSDDNQNYRIRYSSWLNNGGGGTDGRFTLANTTGTITGGDEDTIVDSGASFDTTAKRGDLVYNTTGGGAGRGYAYITSVTDDTTIELDRTISGQITTDTYELNCVPIAMLTADDVYVPFIDQHAISSSASVSIIYDTTIYYRARVRNVAHSTPIKPFEGDSSLSGANSSVQTVRTEDTIYT